MADEEPSHKTSVYLKSLRYMLQWMVIAVVSGLVGVLLVSGFSRTITLVQRFIPFHGRWIIPIAVLGAVVAASISRLDPASRGEGIPSYIRGLRDHGGDLNLKTTVVKLLSSFASLATWGNGGLVGPLGRVSAGISSNLFASFKPAIGDRSLRRTAAICGLSAVLASITGAPLGSGVFAVEVIQKRDMRYSELFPSVLSSSLVVLIGEFFPLGVRFQLKEMHAILEIRHLPALFVTVLLSALAGRLFELFYGRVSRFMRRDSGRAVELRFAAAALVSVGITWLVNPEMLGIGRGFLHALFESPEIAVGRLGPSIPLVMAVLLMILVRALAVGLTVGSGQSAGFFAPLAQLGMLIGTAVALAFGYNDNPGDIHILQAVGLAGLLASSQNVPLAAALMVSEVFGPHLGFPAALAAILGFQLNRQHTVYDLAPEYDDLDTPEGEYRRIFR